jgi:hypothetical protein
MTQAFYAHMNNKTKKQTKKPTHLYPNPLTDNSLSYGLGVNQRHKQVLCLEFESSFLCDSLLTFQWLLLQTALNSSRQEDGRFSTRILVALCHIFTFLCSYGKFVKMRNLSHTSYFFQV